MFGYHGRALFVDLTSQQTRWEPISANILKRFIGGIGLGTYLLYKHCPPKIDPLDPANPLIFVCSPLVGSRLTTSSKFAVVTKSPLTGFIGDSLSSSFLATEIKKLGCDALIITGKSQFPTLLYLDNNDASFIDARQLIGLSTTETEITVKKWIGNRAKVASIGPAGERLIRFASIANDGGRQAGRTGSGAVMGSKNLKAIAITGSNSAPVFDSKALQITGKNLSLRSLGTATEKYRTLGTLGNVSVFNRLGTLPTRNFQQSTFEEAENISGEQFHETHLVKSAHCANCTIGCEKIVATIDSDSKTTGRMEYESVYALGSLVGLHNSNTVIRASKFCDEAGMDTISAGATVAWAMECFERNILTTDDTGGLELKFGDDLALAKTLEMIVDRAELGNLLAEGSRRAALSLGKGSIDWAMQVKGLEMPGYEPRSLQTMALGLAVSTRGACHNRSSAYEADFSTRVNRLTSDRERGAITMEGEDFSSVLDSLIWCKFLRKAFDDFYLESANIYQQVTGWDMQAPELKRAGERISNLKKLFNIREGWQRCHDTLPPRILTEQLPTGVAKGAGLCKSDLDLMISSYYQARGWTESGDVPIDKIMELDILDIVEE